MARTLRSRDRRVSMKTNVDLLSELIACLFPSVPAPRIIQKLEVKLK